MARFKISEVEGNAAVTAVVDALTSQRVPEPAALATAVRFTLSRLEQRAPGNTLEVRVPPYGAIQCVAGPRHTRGTPPNVIETDPETWMRLATGMQSWGQAVTTGRVLASGTRATLDELIPLWAE